MDRRNGVGVILKEEDAKNGVAVKRELDRVIRLKLDIEGVRMNIVGGFPPQFVREIEELDEVIESVPREKRAAIRGDFNGHVGERNRDDGRLGVKERDQEGQMVMDFANRIETSVVNTYIQTRKSTGWHIRADEF